MPQFKFSFLLENIIFLQCLALTERLRLVSFNPGQLTSNLWCSLSHAVNLMPPCTPLPSFSLSLSLAWPSFNRFFVVQIFR